MKSTQVLLNVMEQESTSRQQRRVTAGGVTLVFVCIIVGLIYLGVGGVELWQAWQTTSWFHFWTPATTLIFFLFIPLIALGRVWGPLRRPSEGARLLRAAAAGADDRIAPLAVFQPAPFSGLEYSSGQTRIGPLPRMTPYGSSTGTASPALILTPVLAVFGLFPLLFFLIDNDFGIFQGAGTAYFGLFPVCIILLAVVPAIIVRLRLGRRGLYVIADEQGLEWHITGRSGGPVRVTWASIRTLARISTTISADWAQRTTYFIEAPGGLLMWTISALTSERQIAASEQLLRLTVTRTDKPLRDLSALAMEIAQAGNAAASVLAGRIPAGSAGSDSRPLLPDLTGTPPQPDRRRSRVGLVLAVLVPVLLFAALHGGGWWLQSYQPTYFAGLPTRIHAETPLYHDDLSTLNGDWPVATASANQYATETYSNGVYQLSGNVSGKFVDALGPQEFGDAAIEVNAAEAGQAPNGDYDGVGIVFHSDADSNNFLLFRVNNGGTWQLWQYSYVDGNSSDDWTDLHDGHSNAIKAAPATNRLLIVTRGGVYLFYANDQFFGSYNNQYDDLPTSGYAGVYLNETAMVGTFSQFTVYPVQPPSSFWYV